MDSKLKQKFFIVYKWLTAAVTAASAVTLAVLCVKIYSDGDRAFSREAVANALSTAAPLLYITAALVIGGCIFSIFINQEKRVASKRDPYTMLNMYKKRYSIDVEKAGKEEKIRIILRSICCVISVIIAVFPLVYLADSKNFTVESLNSDIVSATVAVMIPAAIIFVIALICSIICANSAKREAEIYKNAVINGNAEKKEKSCNSERKTALYIRYILLSAAVVMIVIGIFNDGIGDVYGKAVRICTECIGLG